MICIKQSDIVKAVTLYSPITGERYISFGKGGKRVVIMLER